MRFPPPLGLALALARGPFWRTLAVAGVLVVGALAAMAVTLALSLGEAGKLLDRLGRSQDQLAMVTRIEGDVGRLRADLLAGDTDLAAAEASIAAQIADYQASVLAESQLIGRSAGPDQAAEVERAAQFGGLFETVRQTLPAVGAAGASADFKRVQLRFDDLAELIISKERVETRSAITGMRRLRRQMTLLGVAIPAAVAVLAAFGAWVMWSGMAGPLRVLETAAGRAGRGERISPEKVEGFAELLQLGDAFGRMDEQIASQREALAEANRGLEAQVLERTAEIEAGREKLAEIDRTRRTFYSQIGHELRTPVTVIRGEAEIALRDPSSNAEGLREALEHVAANGAFLQRRLEDMLALARAEDGRIALRKEKMDLGELVRRTTVLAEPYVRSSGARLVAELANTDGPMIEGDAAWLQQGLLALVDNAAKFSGGEGAVRLKFEVGEKEARIVVSDTGVGVDEADLPYLFETYFQTKAGRARGGSGLGLSVARWVVEQHGGAINATSAPQKGLTVAISLPVSQ